MSLNFALSREIYGGIPWMVDRLTFATMSNMLSDFRNGVQFNQAASEKLNSISLYGVDSRGKLVSTTNNTDANSSEQLVSVIKLNGPIVKNGGMSSYGMQELGDEMIANDKNPNVIGHVIMGDSGGGSSAGMEVMVHALDSLTKPKAYVVERGGVTASAAYGIAAHTDRIFSESKKAVVGSIGSMISFKAQPNKTTDANGEKQVTIYATPSTKKNLWFEEALNNDNYDLAISEILDPHVEDFRSDMRKQRPNLDDSHLDGSTYEAGKVVGTLVDQIGGLNDAINFVKSESKSKLDPKINNNQKITMTAQEILAQHPEAHAAIFAAGVSAERSRVKVWLAHHATDSEVVIAGIKGGTAISDEAREELLVKASSVNPLKKLKSDSSKDVVTDEAKDEKDKVVTAEEKEWNDTFGVNTKYKIPFTKLPSKN